MQQMRNVIIFLLAGLLFPFTAFSQAGLNPESHTLKKRVFVAPDGNVFIWSKANIYLSFSTSPEKSAERHLLLSKKSLDSNKKPAPFSLEGHGRHTIVHPADHKNMQKTEDENIFPLFEDSHDPIARVSVTDAPMVVNGSNIIYGKPVKVSLTFKDEDSGIQSSFTSMNGAKSTPYRVPINLTKEGDYHFKYYTFDNVGNKSRLYKRYYSLDFTPPESNIKIDGPHIGTILSPKAKIMIKSRDEKAGVKEINFKFPVNAKKASYKKPILMSKHKDGNYVLQYGAVDRVTNKESNKRYAFYLDSIPPVVSYELFGDQYNSKKKTYVSHRTTVGMSATDNKAGVRRIRYFLKSKQGEIYQEPFGFAKKNGSVTFGHQASDNVINISSRVNKTVIVDISSPTMKIVFHGQHYFSRKTHYIRRNTEISYATNDNLSGVQSFEYILDKSKPISAKSKFTIKKEGQHTISTTTIDNVQNERNNHFFLFVDETPPELFPRFGVIATEPGDAAGNNAVYPTKTLFYLSATDDQSGMKKIQYRINSGPLKDYKSALNFPKEGRFKIEIIGTDNVGNVSKKTTRFRTRKY
ncbi:MAG: hypothetical protein GY786_21045 [Proteobacteria bacterium]|nr:hypothetical protein [Pseudomonadota bacterium]